MEKKIALITGASSGLGEEYINQIQEFELDEIWAVARRKNRLEKLAESSGIPLRPVPMDLTRQESMDQLEAMLKEEQPHITLLINAAGFGKIGSYAEMPRSEIDRMIDLNCRAAVDVTLISLPYMREHDQILEICSTAAFQPFQFLNVYAASKSFLYRFSRALGIELRPRKISVTAVCPYWVKDTEFIPVAKDTDGAKAVRDFPFSSRKKSVVRLSLAGARLRLPVSTPGIMCTLHRIAAKFIPSFIMCWIWAGIRRL